MRVVYRGKETTITRLSYLAFYDPMEDERWFDILPEEARKKLSSALTCNVYFEAGGWDNIANVNWLRKIK
jgi:hypothetical protein